MKIRYYECFKAVKACVDNMDCNTDYELTNDAWERLNSLRIKNGYKSLNNIREHITFIRRGMSLKLEGYTLTVYEISELLDKDHNVFGLACLGTMLTDFRNFKVCE